MPELQKSNGSTPHSIDTGDSLTIEFVEPISVNGKTYERLVVETPTAGQVMTAEAELANGLNIYARRRYQIAIVTAASGLPRAVIEKMKLEQMEQAANFLSRYLDTGQETGASSSPS